MISQNSLQLTKEFRQKVLEITKLADELITFVDKSIVDRENELDEKIKKLHILVEKEKLLKIEAQKIVDGNKELKLKINVNREKQLSLEKQEEEIEKKLHRVQTILN